MISIVQHSGALAKCQELAEEHVVQAQTSLDIIKDSALKDLLLNLARYSLARQS